LERSLPSHSQFPPDVCPGGIAQDHRFSDDIAEVALGEDNEKRRCRNSIDCLAVVCCALHCFVQRRAAGFVRSDHA
jgi:hypothetical protein